MKSLTIKQSALALRVIHLITKYDDKAYENVCRKGLDPDMRNIIMEILDLREQDYQKTS